MKFNTINSLILGVIIVMIILFCATSESKSQDITKPKLYIAMNDLDPSLLDNFSKNHVEIAILVTQGNIDPTNQMKLDEEKLKSGILRLFPDPKMKGIGILDWESNAFRMLRDGNVNNPLYSIVLNEYIKAIRLAKSMRPNVKWGFYEIPIITPNGRKRANALDKLLKECDIFFPSFYQYHPYALNKNNATAVKNDLTYSLSLGEKYNKPVMPFVWHRWNITKNGKRELSLISINQFTEQIKLISTYSYKGRMVEGVIWWGAEKYYYDIKGLPSSEVNSANTRFGDFNTYRSNLILQYYQSISGFFR